MGLYLTGKFGKSIRFNPKHWKGLGGDNEAPTLLIAMAKNNPDDDFLIIGKNDLTTYDGTPPNLYSLSQYVKVGLYTQENPDGGDLTHVWETIKHLKIDGCFMIAGPTGSTNLIDVAYKRGELAEGNKIFAKTLMMHKNYSAQIYYYLNKSMIPWVMICNDPRYMFLGRDMLNMPQHVLSQINGVKPVRQLKSFEDQREINMYQMSHYYSEMEKIYLIGRELYTGEKTEKFMIVLNEGNNGVASRFPIIKEYVLDTMDDVEIYGKWNPKVVGDDKRFVGSVPFMELQEKLKKVKYTFIVPIKKGWATMKVWEMLANGVIPFLYPTYDIQHNLDIPDFLRVNSPEELYDKIELLEQFPEKRQALLEHCLTAIRPSDFDGTNLSNIIQDAMNGFDYTHHVNGDEDLTSLKELN